jgi:tetratricopeptide (TPR) repeat protein
MKMKFDDFLSQAWNDHAKQAEEVAKKIPGGIALIEKGEEIPQMAHLITHVFGEHLGRWEQGVQVLQGLKQNPCFVKMSESDLSISRSIASLEMASGKRQSVEDLSTSDQIRVLAVAASALSEQKNSDKAQSLFRQALDSAQIGIIKDDPANRALAVTGNNLACSLEEKAVRTPKDTELMILAAQTGRKYWEIAGTWKQVTWGEYRLAMTYLKAGDLVQSLEHAQACLELAQEHETPPLEMFFGYEVLALIEKARENSIGFSRALEQAKAYFEKLSADDKSACFGPFRHSNSELIRHPNSVSCRHPNSEHSATPLVHGI